MNAVVTAIFNFGVWIVAEVAAKWGYKIGLVAGVVAVFGTVWVCLAAAFITITSLLKSTVAAAPLSAFLLQFFPSAGALGTAITTYIGTLACKRLYEFWLAAYTASAKVAS
jgi:hypothetical protein